MFAAQHHTTGDLLLQTTCILPQNPIKTNQNWSKTNSHTDIRPNKTVTDRFFWTWTQGQNSQQCCDSPVFLLRVLMSTTAAWFFSVKCLSKIMLCFSLALSMNTVWLPTHRTWEQTHKGRRLSPECHHNPTQVMRGMLTYLREAH